MLPACLCLLAVVFFVGGVLLGRRGARERWRAGWHVGYDEGWHEGVRRGRIRRDAELLQGADRADRTSKDLGVPGNRHFIVPADVYYLMADARQREVIDRTLRRVSRDTGAESGEE